MTVWCLQSHSVGYYLAVNVINTKYSIFQPSRFWQFPSSFFSLYNLISMHHLSDLPVSLTINRLGALWCLQCGNVTIHASSCQRFHLVKALSYTYTHSVCYRLNTLYWSITKCRRTDFIMHSMSSSRNPHCAGKVYSPVQYCVNFVESYVS